MRAQQQEAKRLSRPAAAGQNIAHRQEVAEGLRHLLAIDQQHAIVQPSIGHAAGAMSAAALRHLILMMREHQVGTAAMNVEHLAQMFPRHGRAFDMPARPATAPGAVPTRGFGIRGLPQHEIPRIALIRRHIDARAGQQLILIAARELAVICKGGD